MKKNKVVKDKNIQSKNVKNKIEVKNIKKSKLFYELGITYMLSFVLIFMFVIYENIVLYCSNMNDFWFGFNILVKNNLILFAALFFIVCIFDTIIFILLKIILKRKIAFNIYILIYFCVFLYLYVQGNYLSSNLPALDGTSINWNEYFTESIISYVAIALIFIINIILFIKLKKDKYNKIVLFSSIIIFIMLLSSFITVLITNLDAVNKRNNFIVTTENLNVASNDTNVFIFLADAVDSTYFNKVVEDNDYQYLFEDFTYYPDTLSVYPYTRDSIPYILSGILNKNEDTFSTYYNKALNNSILLNKLNDENYNINIYEEDFLWNTTKTKMVNNVEELNIKIDMRCFYFQEIKYLMLKYLPYSLKKYSKIETLNYNNCKKIDSITSEKGKIYNYNDINIYNDLSDITLIDDKYFQFIHIEGSHVPFDINKNLEQVNGTYEDKIEATLTIFDKYISRIKDSGIYDNSIIIVMSDHGYNFSKIEGRQNPILYVKGLNEHHSLEISDKKVSYEDLNDMYMDLLNGKSSEELFENISQDRIRKYIWYKYLSEDYMIEYELDGHAWETDKMVKTGNEFRR